MKRDDLYGRRLLRPGGGGEGYEDEQADERASIDFTAGLQTLFTMPLVEWAAIDTLFVPGGQ